MQSLQPPTISTATVDPATDFVAARPRLFGIAFRILGSAMDAEDVVQDVWFRWQRTDRSLVRDRTAFLVTITTRAALTAATSARARREFPIGDGMTSAARTVGDPAAAVERAAALDLGVAFLLERLSSLEFAVFVLREGFDYPFRDIAQTLGLCESNTRQIARRARVRLSGRRRLPVNVAQLRCLLGAIRGAAATGEMGRLKQVLTQTVGHRQAA